MQEEPSRPSEPRLSLPAPAEPPFDAASFDDGALAQAAPSQAMNLRRTIAVLIRHKWMIVAMTVLGTGVGYVLTRLVPSAYLAQATLWIQESGQSIDTRQSGPIQPQELLRWSSWVDLMKSFVVLDEVVRRQHLYLEPADPADSAVLSGFQLQSRFVPGDYRLRVAANGRSVALIAEDKEVQRVAVGDSLGGAVGFSWLPRARELRPGREVRFKVRTPREAALKLRDDLRTILPEQGSFLRLELTGPNPGQTAGTLNTVADRFVEVAADLKRQKLSELSKILDQQLTSSYAALGNAERALQGFRVHTITLPSEQASPVTPGLQQTEDPVFKSFFSMRVDRDQLDRDRRNILAALAQADSEVSEMQLEAIPSVQQSEEMKQALTLLAGKEADARAMRLQFGASYPPLKQAEDQIADLRRRVVPDLARKLASELAARIRDTDARIGSAATELQQIPARAIEEARLRRDVTIAENLYTTLQQRYEEARLAEVSSIPDVRILDRAVTPDRPLKNKAVMLLLGGLLGGMGGAVGLSILLDRFDRRVRYPDQISFEMGLTLLGAIPRLRTGHKRLGAETESQVVEALRSVRLNVEHAYGVGPVVVTVTSPGTGDGKSFLSSNLAVSFADAGQRTLVIDGDIRRGTLHRVFGLERKPGLLDYLAGRVSRDQIFQATKVKGVDFIGSGTRRNAGPELLASAAMSQLLIACRNQYQVIIIDCSPLGAGVDPLVLGALTGNLILMLRTGVTDREFAKTKLAEMSRLPIRVLGAVLNDVTPGAGYEYYYHYAYLPGYGTMDEESQGAAQAKRLPAAHQ